MSKKLKIKKKKPVVSQFERKFHKAINYRIKMLTDALKFNTEDFKEVAKDFRSRVDELESLKEYLK